MKISRDDCLLLVEKRLEEAIRKIRRARTGIVGEAPTNIASVRRHLEETAAILDGAMPPAVEDDTYP
jgi:hypothetical protein